MSDYKAEVGGPVKGHVRQTRSDKRICVKTNLDQESHLLLNRLAMTVGKSKTALATEIVETILRNPAFINWVQDHYKVSSEHRLIPKSVNGKFSY